MAMPSSGNPISMDQMRTEWGLSGSLSMNAMYKGGSNVEDNILNTNIASSGAIDFQSTSTAVNANLDFMSMYTTGLTGSTGQHVHLAVQGRPHLTKDGSNTLYMGIVGGASNTWSFSTAVVTSRSVDVSALDAAELVNADIEGTDPRKVFAPGDIIHAEDDIIIGEIKSMADANTITFKADGEPGESDTDYTVPANFAAWAIQNGAGAAGDLASGDELYNVHPITVLLHCEK